MVAPTRNKSYRGFGRASSKVPRNQQSSQPQSLHPQGAMERLKSSMRRHAPVTADSGSSRSGDQQGHIVDNGTIFSVYNLQSQALPSSPQQQSKNFSTKTGGKRRFQKNPLEMTHSLSGTGAASLSNPHRQSLHLSKSFHDVSSPPLGYGASIVNSSCIVQMTHIQENSDDDPDCQRANSISLHVSKPPDIGNQSEQVLQIDNDNSISV